MASPSPGDEEAQVAPWFPSVQDAVEANQASLAGWGQTNHALLRPEALEGALNRAPNYWHYEQSIPKAAAALAHGVGQAQSFEDGNKRTAYWLTHAFLHNNGYGHMMPDDDQELADHLIGYGEGTHGMGDTAAMFEQRRNGTPSQGDPTPPERLGRLSAIEEWTPGTWGKGWLTPDGLTTWKVGEMDGHPWHREVAQQIGLPETVWSEKAPSHDVFDQGYYPLQIDPDGIVNNSWSDDLPEDVRAEIRGRDRRLRFPRLRSSKVQSEWQHGLCHPYARALQELTPHLRFGEIERGDGSFHNFAHDDEFAYDSLGTHPLKGFEGPGDHMDLDVDPQYSGVPGSPEDVARARAYIQSGRTSNILDPIHQSLDPAVWDQPDSSQPKLRADHQKWITDRIFKVLDDHGYDNPAKWLTLILTGSLTTYQYSDDSDCDVSLFVNSEAFPEWSRAEMIGIMISEVDGAKLPGTTHPMQDFVVSRKLSPTDLYKPGLRSGYIVYGDGEGTWVVPPERSRVHDVEKEENEAYTIALENADKMEKLLRYEPDKAVMFWHQIHKRRQRDMQAGKGDFSPSNITYKMLFNRGLTDQLSEVSGEYIA